MAGVYWLRPRRASRRTAAAVLRGAGVDPVIIMRASEHVKNYLVLL
eukprot:SAG31_NODE_885_length_11254_cov_14.613088_8_plen_46_part_00